MPKKVLLTARAKTPVARRKPRPHLDQNASTKNPLSIIGSSELIQIGGYQIPAKIDTGADSSSIWASKIRVSKDGVLKFALFGQSSPLYTGKVFKRTDFSVVRVRSTTGHQQIRYRTYFKVIIAGRKIRILMNLANRSKNQFPVLIGRRSISRKFLVDVNRNPIKKATPSIRPLNDKLGLDPYKFHKTHFKKGQL